MDWSFLSTKKISQVYYQHISNHCYFCRIKSKQLICSNCLNGFSLNTCHCKKCKLPTSEAIELCGECQQKRPQYEQLISPLVYIELTQRLITHLKFSANYHACHPLCHFLAEALNTYYTPTGEHHWPDTLIPVPSHIERVRERGFCHTTLLSRYLTMLLDQKVPLNTDLLHKRIHTDPQHKLNKSKRNKLTPNNFSCTSKVPQHVALFDDVITTGSTIDACITKLKQAGAERVDVWSLARTPAVNFKVQAE